MFFSRKFNIGLLILSSLQFFLVSSEPPAGVLFYRKAGGKTYLLLAQTKKNRWGDVGGLSDTADSGSSSITAAREAAEELSFILDTSDNLKVLMLDKIEKNEKYIYLTKTFEKFFARLKQYKPFVKVNGYVQYVVEWDDNWGLISKDALRSKFFKNREVLKRYRFLEMKDVGWFSRNELPSNQRFTLKETLSIPGVKDVLFSTGENAQIFKTIIYIAISAAIVSVIGVMKYRHRKRIVLKKYAMSSLTPLQESIWKATALAAAGIPWYLRYLSSTYKNYPLSQLVGKNKEAITHFYYGFAPNEKQSNQFYSKFFKNHSE